MTSGAGAGRDLAASPVRLPAALAASALVHALALAVVLTRPTVLDSHPALAIIPISLVGTPGGGGGGQPVPGAPAGPPAEPTPEPAASEPPRPAPVPRAVPKPVPRPVAHPPKPRPAAPPSAERSPSANAAGAPAGTEAPGAGPRGGGSGGTGGAGAGDGTGGDGSGGARVAYGTNPLPPYPLVARRLGMEGVVLLEVVVAPDGRAADVRVGRSSGFPALDQSALTTVRERWRFIPARRDGVPVESRVTVPIRFRLDGTADDG